MSFTAYYFLHCYHSKEIKKAVANQSHPILVVVMPCHSGTKKEAKKLGFKNFLKKHLEYLRKERNIKGA